MEEDIKILEEKKAIDDLFSLTHINGYINLYELKKATIYTSDLKKWQNGVKVLLNQRENLIKGYRELEKRIISLTNLLCINDSDENYIPKSKIKEIRDKAEVMDYYTLNNVIDDLTKLLGDEK